MFCYDYNCNDNKQEQKKSTNDLSKVFWCHLKDKTGFYFKLYLLHDLIKCLAIWPLNLKP